MRICIPTLSNQGDASTVSGHFGSAPFLALVETETGEVEIVPTEGCQGGGDHHIRQLTDDGVQAVVCARLGRRAAAALRRAGIQVLRCSESTVSAVAIAARGGRLRPVAPEDACRGGGRHRGARGGGGRGTRDRSSG